MAQFRAGRTGIAGTALQAAENELSKGWFDGTRKHLGGHWHHRLIGNILLREARGLRRHSHCDTEPVIPARKG